LNQSPTSSFSLEPISLGASKVRYLNPTPTQLHVLILATTLTDRPIINQTIEPVRESNWIKGAKIVLGLADAVSYFLDALETRPAGKPSALSDPLGHPTTTPRTDPRKKGKQKKKHHTRKEETNYLPTALTDPLGKDLL
jgi:hypothetical protein